MKLYCDAQTVIAVHDDDQNIDPAVYGTDVEILVVADDYQFENLGPEPEQGEPDNRPLKRPDLVGDVLVASVKSECARRIYATASQATQTNIAAAVGVISGRTASDRSNDEKTILADAETAITWVAAMRANVAVLVADPNLDRTDDGNWPVTPHEVIALAALF